MSNQNYRLEEKNSKKIDVHLLYITEAKYEQDWHSLAHTHHFTELFFITHGTGKFTIENECFPVKEVRKKEENFESICQNLLELIIWNITRQTQTTLSVAPTKKITKECRFIEQYLDEHFKEDITLQTLSDLTYLNKYYLVHAFKNYKGVSPINYLIEKRISEAKHLLGTTNFPIAKIASVVGFSSQSYFSQVFRKETGLSPNKYRKSMDSQNEAGGLI